MKSKVNVPKSTVERSHPTFLRRDVVISPPVVRRSPPLTFPKILAKGKTEATRKESIIERTFGISFKGFDFVFGPEFHHIVLASRSACYQNKIESLEQREME